MKVLKESYTQQEIMDFAEEVFQAYRNLRSTIYTYETSVEGIENLERNARIARTELEELWRTTLRDILDDTQEQFETEEEKRESLDEAARGRYVGSGYIDVDAVPDVFDYDDEIHDRLGEEECDFYKKGQNDYAAVFSDGYERDVPREYAIITSEPQKGRKLPFAFVAVNHPIIPLGTKKNGEVKFGSNLSSVDSVRIDPVGTVEDHSFFGPSGWKNWMGTGGNISRWCQALGVDMKNLAEVRLGDRYVLFTLKDGSQVAGEDIKGVSYYVSRDFKPVSLHGVIEALYDSSKEVIPSWNKSAYHGTLGYVKTSNPLLQSAEFIREE